MSLWPRGMIWNDVTVRAFRVAESGFTAAATVSVGLFPCRGLTATNWQTRYLKLKTSLLESKHRVYILYYLLSSRAHPGQIILPALGYLLHTILVITFPSSKSIFRYHNSVKTIILGLLSTAMGNLRADWHVSDLS